MSVPRGHPAPDVTEVPAVSGTPGVPGVTGPGAADPPRDSSVQVTSDIAAGVHEVQNVLTSALGWVQLARATQSPEVHAQALAVVERALGRAGVLVASLADPVARARVDATVFDPTTVMSEVYELLHPRCAARGVDLRTEPLAEGVKASSVRGDPARATQVVTNLVINALEAVVAAQEDRPSAGVVTLSAVFTAHEIGISVRDDGTGIDPATRARMFEPRFTTRPGRGSGLGLPVARSLADAMGAWITVATEPGRGTEVTLWLPRLSGTGSGAYALVSAPPPALRAGTRVLVLDDEPAIRELLEVALTLRGASVVAVGDIESARRTLARRGADVALVDETLGTGISGVSFIAEIAAQWPEVGRVLMTGAPAIDHLKGACEHFVRKPFLLDDVVRVLRDAMGPG